MGESDSRTDGRVAGPRCCGKSMEWGFVHGASSMSWFGAHEKTRFAVGIGHRITCRGFTISGVALHGYRCMSCGALQVKPGPVQLPNSRLLTAVAVLLAVVLGFGALMLVFTRAWLVGLALGLLAAALVLGTHLQGRAAKKASSA